LPRERSAPHGRAAATLPPRERANSEEEISASTFIEELTEPEELNAALLVEDTSDNLPAPRSVPPRPPPSRRTGTLRPGIDTTAQPPRPDMPADGAPGHVVVGPLPAVARGEEGPPPSVAEAPHEGGSTNGEPSHIDLPKVHFLPSADRFRALAAKLNEGFRRASHALRRALPTVKARPVALAATMKSVEQAIRPRLRSLATAMKTVASRVREALSLRAFPKGPAFLSIVAGAGLCVGILLAVLIAHAVRKSSAQAVAGPANETAPSLAETRSPASSKEAALPTDKTAALTETPSADISSACTLAGLTRTVAPRALMGPGIDVRTEGGDVAVGYATAMDKAAAVRLDPASLSTTATATTSSRRAIVHVATRLTHAGGLGLVVDTDGHEDNVHAQRTVLNEPFIQLAVSDETLVYSRDMDGRRTGKLWPLSGTGEVDAIQAAMGDWNGSPRIAIVFRQGNRVGFGLADAGDPIVPLGDLHYFDSLDAGMGAPAVGVGSGEALIGWADRPATDAPWSLRLVRMHDETLDQPWTFAPPGALKDESAMSPTIASLPGKRFLVAWTEGPSANHRVRAATLSARGEILGASLDISEPGLNCGAPRLAVTPSGRGVVAFLESSGNTFAVAATAVSCGM
jgi:hypothetical protein